MRRISHSFPFVAWLVLCALAGATGVCWLQELRVAVRREKVGLARRRAECERLGPATVASGPETEQALATALAGAERSLAAVRSERADRDRRRQQTPPPKRPVDAFFEMASFVGRMRKLANNQQVRIKADEHFGFASLANRGPEAGTLAAVHRQSEAVEELVRLLLAAEPRELVAVRRQRPPVVGSRSARAPTVAADPVAAADYFEPDPRLALPGTAGGHGGMCRLEFTGQTPALRNFLNSVAASPLPLVVRCVEVEPLSMGHGPIGGPASPVDAPRPLIARSLSKFSVIVADAGMDEPAASSRP